MNQCILVGTIKSFNTTNDNNYIFLKVKDQEVQIELNEEFMESIKNESSDMVAIKCFFTANETGNIELKGYAYAVLNEVTFAELYEMNQATTLGISEKMADDTLILHTLDNKIATFPIPSHFGKEIDSLREHKCIVSIKGSVYFDSKLNANRLEIQEMRMN